MVATGHEGGHEPGARWALRVRSVHGAVGWRASGAPRSMPRLWSRQVAADASTDQPRVRQEQCEV